MSALDESQFMPVKDRSGSWRVALSCLYAASLILVHALPGHAQGADLSKRIDRLGGEVSQWDRKKDACMDSVKRGAKDHDDSDRPGQIDKERQDAIKCVSDISIQFDEIWIDMDELIMEMEEADKAGTLREQDLDQMSQIRTVYWSGAEEFMDEIFNGDLDGYLLIGSGNNVDGAYLPRNYDNDIPGQNADLPLRRS